MKKELILITGIIILNFLILPAQNLDSVKLKVGGVESRELLEYYRFEGIHYFDLRIIGTGIKNQYFVLTCNEFWGSKSMKMDTIANTKTFQMKNGKDTLGIRVMSKKISSDTTKFQFNLPGFSTIRKFKTTQKDTYSLRDITSKGEQTFAPDEPINLLVYSLPYEDPEKPGYLYYCELSREGVPPEKWGEKFGVQHHIIFKIQLID